VDADAGGGGRIAQEIDHRRDAETQRKTKTEKSENAEMAESAEKTFFFNSLRLRVSAVIIRSWGNPERPI
jgi:hypothetical protein